MQYRMGIKIWRGNVTFQDKVDMSLTKKEFMMAVKLCSDVAVQRGLPNMRLRAAKNFHSKGKESFFLLLPFIYFQNVKYKRTLPMLLWSQKFPISGASLPLLSITLQEVHSNCSISCCCYDKTNETLSSLI